MDSRETELERETRSRYSGDNGVYQPETISHLPDDRLFGFSENLLRFKLGIVRQMAAGAALLDIGCGNGLHAIELARYASKVDGVDYSENFISYARSLARERGVSNVNFSCANARSLPHAADSFDVAYCFAALYYMPSPLDVITEIARVLKPGGKCVLEFGNVYSLNTIVCKYYPELAKGCHIPVGEMTGILRRAGLIIERHHSFQLLPMWADRPWWLRPLLHPAVTRALSKQIHGRMLDERISSLPLLKNFAFRHLFVARKQRPADCGKIR